MRVPVLVVSLVVSALSLAQVRAAADPEAPENGRILLNVGAVDPQADTPTSSRQALRGLGGPRLHLVQFDGPIQPDWVEQLTSAGLRIINYIPHNAYLVYGDAAARASLASLRQAGKHVRWEGAYLDSDKIQPRARPASAAKRATAAGNDQYVIQMVDDSSANAVTLSLIDQLKLAPVVRVNHVLGYVNVVVRLPESALAVLAASPEVVSINAYVTPRKFDERQDIIIAGQLTGNGPSGPGYLAWLASKGFTQSQFTASGLLVDVTDSGVDNGTNNPNHFGLYVNGATNQASRVIYNRLEGTANSGSTIQGCDGHGNLNAHVIGGNSSSQTATFPFGDSAGYQYGLGVCPFVKLGSSVIFDPGNFTTPDYEDLISRAYRDGARINSDSWGADTAGDYDTDAQAYDALVRDAQPTGAAVSSNGNQGMTIVFAAGNAGSGAQTVGSPGTAKNVITVGAAENVHSHSSTNLGSDASGNDGCTTPDTEANSANDIASFSSRGPCSDSRRKPEIVAPGTHITGGVAQQTKTMSGTGNDLSCFDGTGVCALPGGGTAGSTNNFFPRGQQFYSTSSGTSHSTPAVAGGCALIYQWFLNNSLNAPSPAMVKAFLMNAARYMNGTSANDALWSNSQGMGMMDLGFGFDGTPRILRDQDTNDLFTASGQSRVITATVVSNSKPVRVTLTWTDAPGGTSGNAYNNNLDLTVVAGGQTYRGNVFSGSNSTTGGTADFRNNAESVFLPAGTTGTIVATVSATGINSDGVPNYGTALDQDYALVIYNATEVQAPLVAGAGSQIVLESCGLGNGALDPDEDVSVKFALRNAGSADTTNVVATLQATGGVTAPSGAQSYGALLAGGATVTNTFTFTSTGACGGTVTATLSLLDGATDLGSVVFTFPIGGSTQATTTNSNTGSISIPDSGNGSPYPSTINVSGLAGTVSKVTVTLSGFSHTYASDVDVLLVGPGGENCVLMSAAGADVSVSGLTLTFDDDAASALPDASGLTSGTFQPSNYDDPAFGSPAPSAPYGSALSAFDGVSPNGAWSLYVVDAFAGDSGSIAQGWKLGLTVGEPLCCASNQPPTLGAIGNKSVSESNTLTFAVTASDIYDGHPITLSASNLPGNATFATVTNTAFVTNYFTWTNAGPVGVYTSTFYASDVDGTDSEQITITVSPPPGPSTNIGGWQLIQSNATVVYTFPTTAVVQAGGYLILARSATKSQFESFWGVTLGTNITFITSSNETPSINGSETYTLKDAAAVLRDGPTPASLNVNTSSVQRKSAQSNATQSASWNRLTAASATPGSGAIGDGTAGLIINEYSDATGTGAFSNEFVELYFDSLGGAQQPPVLAAIGAKSASVSNDLSFVVSATPTDGDLVTLTVSNLPAGAVFSPTNENATFTWTNAGPVGVYTTSFYATDNDGSDSETITITISEPGVIATNELALYTFDTVTTNFTTNANSVAAGLTASGFNSADSTVSNLSGSPGRAIGDSGFTSTTNNYYTFTLGIVGTNSLAVKRVKFHDQRSNTGPALWALRSSLDGFVADLASGGTHLSFTSNDIALSMAGITGSVTFRIYGQNASSAGGTWRLDNVGVLGDLQGVAADLPGIVITTADQSVSNPTTTLDVGGTANTNTVGLLSWTNALTGGTGTLAAATNWLISAVPLNVGANLITVSGTNAAGASASDSVTITRQSSGGGGGCSNILFQGFEAGDGWTIVTGATYVSAATGSSDTPASQRIRTGVNSWQVNNSTRTLELAQVSISGYTGCQVSVRVSSTSTNGTNGADGGDNVRVYVALDGTAFSTSAVPDVYLKGNTNAKWGFWATNILSTTAGTIVSNQSPSPNAVSTNNYATLQVLLPESATSVALRVVAENNATHEFWNLDDIALFGCAGGAPDTTPMLVITTVSQTAAFSITNANVGGTSSNLVGLITWTNALAGSAGTIAAADPWLVTGIPLAVGTNVIAVSGSNSLGVVTGATVAITREGPDTDGDGMDDAWEILYFGGLGVAGSNTDYDVDGFIDVHEFLANTIPTNGESLLKTTSVIEQPGNGIVIQWQSASNKTYTLQRSEDLIGGFTGIASNLSANQPMNIYTDPVPTNAAYYRIELQQP